MLTEEMRERGFSQTKSGQIIFNANIFAHFIRSKYTIICTEPETFYVYKSGVYIPHNISAIKKKLYYELQKPCFGTWTTQREVEYIKSLERLVYINKELNSFKNLINLKNGMFDLKTYKLKKHNPKYLSYSNTPLISCCRIPDKILVNLEFQYYNLDIFSVENFRTQGKTCYLWESLLRS